MAVCIHWDDMGTPVSCEEAHGDVLSPTRPINTLIEDAPESLIEGDDWIITTPRPITGFQAAVYEQFLDPPMISVDLGGQFDHNRFVWSTWSPPESAYFDHQFGEYDWITADASPEEEQAQDDANERMDALEEQANKLHIMRADLNAQIDATLLAIDRALDGYDNLPEND